MTAKYLEETAKWLWDRELWQCKLHIRPEGIEIQVGEKHRIVDWLVIDNARINILLYEVKRMLGTE
jgi:hypothetical protein